MAGFIRILTQHDAGGLLRVSPPSDPTRSLHVPSLLHTRRSEDKVLHEWVWRHGKTIPIISWSFFEKKFISVRWRGFLTLELHLRFQAKAVHGGESFLLSLSLSSHPCLFCSLRGKDWFLNANLIFYPHAIFFYISGSSMSRREWADHLPEVWSSLPR